MTVTLVAADDIPIPPDDGLPPGQPYVSPDDLASIPPLFAEAAGQVLLPLVAEIWQNSAGTVHAQLVDAANLPNLPPVSSLAAETYLAQAANTFAQVGDDLWATARSELLAGFEAGESIPQLADRLRGSAGLTARKATLVARTQVLDASNAGSYATAQTSGIDLRKGWLDTPDNRTRETHRLAGAKYGADQQMIPMADQFVVGGYSCDRPHDPTLPPSERYSCRCTLVYSMGEQAVRDAQDAATPPPLPNTSGQIEPPPLPVAVEAPAIPTAARLSADEIREIEVENAIRAAYRGLPEQRRVGVWMADLRERSGLSRDEFDTAIKRMVRADSKGIFPTAQENQQLLTLRDREAAVHIGARTYHRIKIDDPSPRPLPRVGGPGPLPDLSQRTVVQLRALAKQQGIPGYSKLTKPQLVERLTGGEAITPAPAFAQLGETVIDVLANRAGISATDVARARTILARPSPVPIRPIVLDTDRFLTPWSIDPGNVDFGWLRRIHDSHPEVYNALARERQIEAAWALEARRAYRGLTLEEAKAEATRRLVDAVSDAPIIIRRAREASLRDIIEQGRMRTQFETGTSGGLFDPAARAKLEEFTFGLPRDLPVAQRPVYGVVSPGGVGGVVPGQTVGNYGEIQIVLRPAVRSRTTVTVGDSLVSPTEMVTDVRPVPIDAPTWWGSGTSGVKDLGSARFEAKNYIEAQVHGGVRVSDIEEVVFAKTPEAATASALDQAGVPWRVLEAGTKRRPVVSVSPVPRGVSTVEERVVQRAAARERNRIIEQRAAAEQTLAELDDLLVKKAGREAFEQRIAAAQLDPKDLAALRAALGDPAKLRAAVTRITKKQGITVQAKTGAKVKFDPELHDPVGDVPAAGTPVVVIRRGTTLTVDGDTIALNKAVVKLPTAPVKRAPAKAVKAAVEQPQAGSAAHDAALIRRPLDRDALATIEEYHGGWAAGMNRALRSGHGVIDPAKQDAARLARGMDELMSGQELTEAIAVDRGVVYHELVDMIGGVPKRGATYVDHGFVSTSTIRARLRPGEENAVLHLRVPSGVRAASTRASKGFDSFDPGEVVLDRGLTYRITTNVEMRDGVRHIDVEVVPKGKPVKRAAAKAAKAKPAEVPVSSDPKVAALPRTPGKPPLPAKAAKATNPKFGTTQQGPSYRDAGKAGRPYTPDMGPLPSGAFEENCTNVVQAFEMRMRGFDVQAAPLDVLDKYGYAAGRTFGEIDQLLTDAWRLPDGTPHGRSFSGQAWKSFAQVDEEIDRTWPDGGRGFIFVGKHIFNVVKVRGKPVYYEAQFDANTTRNVTALYKKKYRSSGVFSGGPQEAKLFRVDDLEPVGGILDTITPI